MLMENEVPGRKKAMTLKEVDDAIQFNVPVDDRHPFFVDFSDVRGEFEERTLYKSLKVNPSTHIYERPDGSPTKAIIFLAGMRGSGKTTELAKIAHRLNSPNCFFSVICNLDEGLDVNNMEYMDILIFQISRLIEELQERNVKVDDDILASLQSWFSHHVTEVNKSKEFQYGGTIGLDAGAQVPGLMALLKITLGLKAGFTGTKERADRLRTEFKNNFTAFVLTVNSFLEGVNSTLRKQRIAKEILFVVDGLEKVGNKTVRRNIVEDEINRIQQIKANTIFTLPLELMSLRQKLLQFSYFVSFPFVKVKDKSGNPVTAAFQKFEAFVYKRIDASLFDSAETVRRAIEFSGGSPRELLRILQYTNYWADEDAGKLTSASLDRALKKLAGETVQYVTMNDLNKLKVLKQNNEQGKPTTFDDDWQDLLEKIIVMEYADGTFMHVNPIVEHSELYRQYVIEDAGNKHRIGALGRRAQLDRDFVSQSSGFHLCNLSLKGLKCFKEQTEISFCDASNRPMRWNVVIGENGIGKTTLLRAIVSLIPKLLIGKTQYPNGDFSVIPDGLSRALDLSEDDSVTIDAEFGYSNLHPEGKRQLRSIVFQNSHLTESNSLRAEANEVLVALGYGASRHMQPLGLSNDMLDNLSSSLFSDTATLSNAEEFYLQLEYSHLAENIPESTGLLDAVRKLIVEVLPGVSDIRSAAVPNSTARRAEVLTQYGWVPIPQLSLGYKTMVAWIIDFAAKLFYLFPNSPNPFAEPVICLVDEIDLHLHPQWQRDIVEFLLRTFSGTQFIVTAHSPLIVQASAEANIILLKRSGDHVMVDNDPEIVADWRIDQLLTSDLFGLPSARRTETASKIARRRALLMLDQRTEAEERELTLLNEQLANLPLYESQLEKKAQSALDKILEVLGSSKDR